MRPTNTAYVLTETAANVWLLSRVSGSGGGNITVWNGVSSREGVEAMQKDIAKQRWVPKQRYFDADGQVLGSVPDVEPEPELPPAPSVEEPANERA